MKTNESVVAEYMNTLSMLQRDKEEVSNVILGYMIDCQSKDQRIAYLEEALEIIAGLRQCTDNTMSNREVALEAIENRGK